MKFLTWAVITLFGVAMLVAMHQLISLMVASHGWEGLKPADWAAWCAAIGTIATLVMTIRIATTETRRRRHVELVSANITAAALAPRIEITARKLVHFQNQLIFQNLDESPYRSSAEEAAFLLDIDFTPATTEELLTLAAHDGNLASKLAYAQARLGVVCNAIAGFVALNPSRPLSTQDARKWERWSEELAERFTVIAASCTNAARTHAPPPTPDELYSPE